MLGEQMEAVSMKIARNVLLSVSFFMLSACGGGSGALSLDAKNAETLQASLNAIQLDQTEENKVKVLASFLMLANGIDPVENAEQSFYAHAFTATKLLASGTSIESQIAGEYVDAARDHSDTINGLSGDELVSLFDRSESKARASRVTKLTEKSSVIEAQLGKISTKLNAEQGTDAISILTGATDEYLSNAKVFGGRIRGNSIVDLHISVDLKNPTTEFLGTQPTIQIAAWPKGNPTLAIFDSEVFIPTEGDSWRKARNTRTIAPGNTQQIRGQFESDLALDAIRYLKEQSDLEPRPEDFEVAVLLGSGAYYGNPRGLSGAKKFNGSDFVQVRSDLSDARNNQISCERIENRLEGELDMTNRQLETFEANPDYSALQRRIEFPDYENDPSLQKCLG